MYKTFIKIALFLLADLKKYRKIGKKHVVIAKNMSLLQDLTQDGKYVLYFSYQKR